MRRFLSRRVLWGSLAGLLTAAVVVLAPLSRGADRDKVDPAALERTRTTVRMLDDVYKSYVVHITATYVRAQETTPAARVTQKVFKHMEEKKWHSARLIDATGSPANKKNLPREGFEKRAVEQLKAGKTFYDEVAEHEGRTVLRAATPVPVVMKQCITCHPGLKEGELMGAFVYELPIR